MKNFNSTLNEVQRLKKGFSGKAKNISVKIFKHPCKGFNFEVKIADFHPLKEYNGHKISVEVKTIGVVNIENLITTEMTIGKFSGITAQFNAASFDENQNLYYRQVMVLPEKLSFTHFIQDEAYQTSSSSFHRGRLNVLVGGSKLEVFAFEQKNAKISYVIIDSLEQINFEAFSERAYRILIALGFVTGKFYQNEGYYFGFDNEAMETPITWRYMALRDTKNAFYHPVYGNAHGIAHNDKTQAEKFQPILKPISLPIFSNLCDVLYQNSDFQALLVLFLEACSSSLLLMPAGLSVVLEGLRTMLKDENEVKFSLMDKKLAQLVKKEMKITLDKFMDKLSQESFSVLEKRINDFDKPTNQSQLLKPFELYGIQLNKSDKEVLNNRNHFLHGRISLGLYEKREDQKAGEEMHYNALKLYTLVSALILKYVGYEGWVINHVKVHERNLGKTIDEPYFIEI